MTCGGSEDMDRKKINREGQMQPMQHKRKQHSNVDKVVKPAEKTRETFRPKCESRGCPKAFSALIFCVFPFLHYIVHCIFSRWQFSKINPQGAAMQGAPFNDQ